MVGYQNKAARNNFNYVTPTFRPIAGMLEGKMSINEIQMSTDVDLAMADLQFLTASGGCAVQYKWVPVSKAASYPNVTIPAGANGAWAVEVPGLKKSYRDPNGTDAEPNTLTVGDGVQVGAVVGNVISFSGQVGEETAEITTKDARNNFNYFGNPFPTDMPVNNIQMSTDVDLAMADLQFLTASCGCAVQYKWVPASKASSYPNVTIPTGANGAWAVEVPGLKKSYRDPNGTDAEPTNVKAGECIQIGAVVGNKFWVLCPYDL